MSNGFDPNIAIDSSPYGNNGVLTDFLDAAAAWLPDSFDGRGYSVKFEGSASNSIIDIAGVNESLTNFSVEFAYKSDDTRSGAVGVLGRYLIPNDRSWLIYIDGNQADTMFALSHNGTQVEKFYRVIRHLSDGVWHRIGMSFAPDDLRCYIDGVEMEPVTITDDPAPSRYDTTFNIWAGWYGGTGTGLVFAGQLDDIRIYNATLSADDFAALFAGSGERNHPLAGHWKLNDPLPEGRTIYLPSAANRDPYEHLTIRNTSNTEDLEVFCQPGDQIDNALASDHVPPLEAITFQAAETNIWARVSNFTDPPPCQVDRFPAIEDLVVTTTPQIIPGTEKVIPGGEVGVALYDFQSRITVTGIPGNQAWDITLGLYNITDGNYIREFHVAGAGNPESDVYHNAAAGLAIHASLVGKQVALGASRATTAGTVTVLADGTAHALTGPIK